MVSFIILNYNGAQLTKECVESIEKHIQHLPFEIIIVDNGSREEDFKQVQKLNYKIVRSRINLGFGGGNMLGANIAKGDYLCFINSDVIFVEDCITPLCRYLESHSYVGCITPSQHNKLGEKVKSFMHSPGIRHEIFKDRIFELLFPKQFPDKYKVNEPTIVDHVNGCFMMFPTEVFWKIKGFDSNIFFYCEEYDISQRLRIIDKKCAVYPNSKIIHINGASTTRDKKVKQELYISRIYTYSKYHNIVMSALFRMIILIKMMVKPHRWYMIPSIIDGEVLSHSMKHSRI